MSTDVITVFSGSPMEAEMITEMLADNDIIALSKNQLMSQIAPFQVAAGGFSPANVEVLLKDQEKAQALIEEFKNS